MKSRSRSQVVLLSSTSRGTSLVELLVVLGIAAALAALATPAMVEMVASLQLQRAADALVNSLTLTRSEAIKRNARVVLCKSRAGRVCETAGGWESGWLVFQDSNNDGQLNAGEELIYQQAGLAKALVFSTNRPVANYVSYTALGTTRYSTGGLQMGTFTVCQKSPGTTLAWDIVIGNVGRPRMAKREVTACPAAALLEDEETSAAPHPPAS